MEETTGTRTIDQITFRQRTPAGPGPFPVILLLHGWKGDENSMLIFTPRLPPNTLWIVPRGIYAAPDGGFGWEPHAAEVTPWIDDFQPAIDRLQALLTPVNFPQADFARFSVMGFSQGAALAYTFALSQPQRFQSLAGLAGFMPEGAHTLAWDLPLEGKKVFVAHGSQDDTVPVERARQAVELLQGAGAQVTYCEDDVGHKLSIHCYKALERFWKTTIQV